jgi:hypothetical protein
MMQQINLYHPIFRKQEKKFSALAMAQAGGAILAGVAVIYGVIWWQVHSIREDVVQADKQLAAVTKRFEEANQKFSSGAQGKTLEDKVANLEKQMAERLRIRDLLSRGYFSNATGYSDFFIAFARQHVNGIWLTGFGITGAGEDLRLQGRTTDPAQVPRYVQRLSAEQVLAGKEFQVFVMSRPEKKQGEATEVPYLEFLFRTASSKEPGKS